MNTPFPATTFPPPTGNRLLGALPEEDYRRLLPHLEPVALPLGKVICEPGERFNHVFFPTAGIVSVLTVLKDGAMGEIVMIGNEGLVGISSFLQGAGRSEPGYRMAVTTAGQACRVRVNVLLEEFNRGGDLRHRLLRYTQAMITQVAQTAVCNRHHGVEVQMCRWLLMRLDRVVGSELCATHEQIANHLGVRRESVTAAASQLQSWGLIRYSRGHILVLDRTGLEQRACECYGVIEREYARLLAIALPVAATPRRVGAAGGLNATRQCLAPA